MYYFAVRLFSNHPRWKCKYTQFSLQTYFLTFWGILFLQALVIFISDKIWVKTIHQNTTLWEGMVHAIEKSHFPFPFTNWHKGSGDCQERRKRKNEAQHEVLITTAINLFFNMILLIPLVILCKYFA